MITWVLAGLFVNDNRQDTDRGYLSRRSMQIKALVFDVFGTVVVWRTTTIPQKRAFGEGHGIAGDWVEFTDRWREGYTSDMAHVNAGKDACKKIDDIRHFNRNLRGLRP